MSKIFFLLKKILFIFIDINKNNIHILFLFINIFYKFLKRVDDIMKLEKIFWGIVNKFNPLIK